MARHTSFSFTALADPAVDAVFARHAGVARFAYNQCRRLVIDALAARQRDGETVVPWSGFDLINAFNAWKRSETAGRIWAVDPAGTATLFRAGLVWRDDVCAQVFEEAAVDLGRGLDAWSKSRRNVRRGRKVGFPNFKRKGRCRESFRLRNKRTRGHPSVTVGADGDSRVIRLPAIGPVRALNRLHGRLADVRKDYLHRESSLLVKTHDRYCLETLAVANLARKAKPRPDPDHPDRWLPNGRSRQRARSRAIADLSWAEFSRPVSYKARWCGGQVLAAPRFLPSTKTCSGCGWVWADISLGDRTFLCQRCGLAMDRDLNAAANLAVWAEAEHASAAQTPDRQAGGRVNNACGGDRSDRHPRAGETVPGTPSRGRSRKPASALLGRGTPEKGAAGLPPRVARQALA